MAFAGAGVGATNLGSQPARASTSLADLSASDVSVSNGPGTLTSLTIDPSFTINYSNLSAPVAQIVVAINAYNTSVGSGGPVVTRQTNQSSPSTSGTFSPTISQQGLLSSDGGPLDPAEFTDGTEGDGAKQTDVEIDVIVRFYDSNGNEIDPTDSKIQTSLTFTVSVTNETASTSISGTLNTNAT